MVLFSARSATRRPWFEDLSLELDAGEVVVLTGPSGSGKTLLLRALADLDPLDAGLLELKGRAREDIPPAEWRARVTYLHQVPVRLPGDVGANIASVQALDAQCRRGAIDPGAGAVGAGNGAELAGLAGVSLDTAAQHLSGGEASRLALYRALGLSPDVLLLDEPTAALDVPLARAAEQAVLAWAQDGGAALWVAHERGLAERLGAREFSLG